MITTIEIDVNVNVNDEDRNKKKKKKKDTKGMLYGEMNSIVDMIGYVYSYTQFNQFNQLSHRRIYCIDNGND